MKRHRIIYMLTASQKGSSSMIIICTTIVIILAAALATDVAFAVFEHYKLLQGAKRIALAGAKELVKVDGEPEKVMRENSVKLINDLNVLEMKMSDTKREITVRMGKPFEYIFLSYAGFGRKQFLENITAKVSGMAEYKGVRPIAVAKHDFAFDKDYYLVNEEGNMQQSIGFIELDLGDNGFETNMIYGFRKNIQVGSGVYPLKNNNQQEAVKSIQKLVEKCRHQPVCTSENHRQDCLRIVVIPVVDKVDAKILTTMKVEGFAAFFIESAVVEKQGIIIKGRFLKYVVESATNDGAPDFGVLAVELIK